MEFTFSHVNRFYLKSHFLLNKAPKTDVIKVVSECCGMNAQTARGPYVSLWNRIAEFEKERLTAALYKEKKLVKTWFMRGTVHIVPAKDFAIYQKALSRNLSEGWKLSLQKHGLGLSNQKREKLNQKILDILSQATLTKRELLPKVQYLLKNYPDREQKIIVSRAIRGLSYQGLLCHCEPTGNWYHFKENRFSSVQNWLNGINMDGIDEEEAKRKLLLKYLHGYAPATIQDFAYWTGFKITDSRKIFDDIKGKLVELKIKDTKGNFWILKEDIDVLESISSEKKPSIRFLPEFDPLIMGHKDKSRILNDKYRKKVFLPLADVAPTILLNGYVVGTWNYKVTNKSLTLSLFESTKQSGQKHIEQKSMRLKQFFLTD